MKDFIVLVRVDGSKLAVRQDSIRSIADDLDKPGITQITLSDGSWYAVQGTVDSIMSERRTK